MATTTAGSDLGPDRLAWDALVGEGPLPSPFLRSWWVESAARHEPVVLRVHDGGRLIGGAAFELDRRLRVPRVLVLGSALGPDHLDVVAAAGRRNEVADAIAAWLREEVGASFLDLDGVVPDSPLVAALDASAPVVEHAPWTPLPPSFDEYLEGRPAGLAKRVRRARAKLARAGARHERAPTSAFEESLDALGRLHAEVFGTASLWVPYFEQFRLVARRGAEAGELVLHLLRTDEEIVAVDVVLEVAGRISTYQGGRRADPTWRGAGLVLQAAFLEDACQRGVREFDHLRGVTDYKLSWAPERRALTRVRAATGIGGRALARAWALRARRARRRRS